MISSCAPQTAVLSWPQGGDSVDEREDYIGAVEIYETDDYEEVNKLLESGDWKLLNTAGGQAEDLAPKFLYCLGRPYREPEPDWV